MPVTHAQQPLGRDGLIGTLDAHHLRLTQSRSTLNQPCGGPAQHHRTRHSDRLHPLRHAHLLTDRGVTESGRTDFAGDHLTGVQADTQSEVHTVAVVDLDRKPCGLLLNIQAGQAGANAWSSNATGAPNTAMIPSPANLSTVPP